MPGGIDRRHRAELAVAALLRGRSVREAADEVGMGRRTLVTWMTEEWFRSQYDAAKKELLDATINMLRSAGEKGVRTLEAVADNKKAPPTARVAAARGLLEVLLRAVEKQVDEERMKEIEKRLGIDKAGTGNRGPGTRAIDLEEE